MLKLNRFKCALSLACVVALLGTVVVPSYASDIGADSLCRVDDQGASDSSSTDKVIVKFRDFVSEVTQEHIADKHTDGESEKVDDNIYIVESTSDSESAVESTVKAYEKELSVEYAEPDYVAHAASFTPNDKFYSGYQAPYLTDMHVQDSWNIEKGSSSTVVAVLDTGVDLDHPDLSGRLVAGYDFVNNDSDSSDDNGHGTMVAGIIAANTNNSIGIAGVNWGCKIMPIKVLDSTETGYVSNMVKGIKYAVDNGASVINMSIGCEEDSQTLQDAVNYAYDHNVLVVASSGNSGGNVKYPAADQHVLAVGAVTTSNALSSYSCYGEQQDVVAVGDNIVSTFFNGTNSSYGIGSGTSYAAPYVTGLASLLLSANSGMTPDEITKTIEDTATDLGTSGWDKKFGYGLISYTAALGSNTAKDTVAPVITLNGDRNVSILAGTEYVDAGATAHDDVDGDLTSYINVKSTVDTNTAGVYRVTYIVFDKAGNKATETRTITVTSAPVVNKAPVITLNGDSSITIKCNDSYVDAGATAYDAVDGDITSRIVTTGTVNTSVAGTYTISYRITNSNGIAADTVTRTVTVESVNPVHSNTAPVIRINGSMYISMSVGTTFSDDGATAYDAEDGNITSRIVTSGAVDTSTAGTYWIYYSVTDSDGLEATTSRRIIVLEKQANNERPVVTLNGSSSVFLNCNEPYFEAGATASDKEDGNLTDKITVEGTVDIKTAGVYKVVYRVTDSEDAEGEATRIITVQANSRPKITLIGSSSVTVKRGTTYTDAGVRAVDAEDGDISDKVVVTNPVDTSKPGLYMIRYDVYDQYGLVAVPVFRTVVVR